MSNRLPNVPPWITGPAHDYLVSLVDAMDRELSQRRELQDGILYVAEEKPLHIIGANGVRYALSVNDSGELSLGPAPQPGHVLGAGTLQAAMATLAGGDGSIAGGLQVGSNSNGEWFILFGAIQVCRVKRITVPFFDAAMCRATWTFPRAFANTSGLVVIPSAAGPTDATVVSSWATDATPSTAEIAEFSYGSLTASDVVIGVERQAGQAGFASGDDMYSTVIAIGTPS